MSSRRQRSIPLGGRYRQVSLYQHANVMSVAFPLKLAAACTCSLRLLDTSYFWHMIKLRLRYMAFLLQNQMLWITDVTGFVEKCTFVSCLLSAACRTRQCTSLRLNMILYIQNWWPDVFRLHVICMHGIEWMQFWKHVFLADGGRKQHEPFIRR